MKGGNLIKSKIEFFLKFKEAFITNLFNSGRNDEIIKIIVWQIKPSLCRTSYFLN